MDKILSDRLVARYSLPSEVAGLTNGQLFDVYQGMETANLQPQAFGFVDTVVFVNSDKSNAFFKIFGEESRWLFRSNMVLLPTGRSLTSYTIGPVTKANVPEEPNVFALRAYMDLGSLNFGFFTSAAVDLRARLGPLFLGAFTGVAYTAPGNYGTLTGPVTNTFAGFGYLLGGSLGFRTPLTGTLSSFHVGAELAIAFPISTLGRVGLIMDFEFNRKWYFELRASMIGGGNSLGYGGSFAIGYRIY